MSAAPTLFDPLVLGRLHARNRVFMAPMTRGRATPDGVPTDRVATYYRQRASAGLIVSEATAISRQGVGWVNAPGIFDDAQADAWKATTAAVHAEGGTIVLQLWHMGRVSHPDFLGGALPVGPSALVVKGDSNTPLGKKPYVTPRALAIEELPGIAADYAAAASRAVAAGFDGVEIHGANGYLIDAFIRDGANQRTDAYGGSIENRWRFPLEVVDAVIAAVGADRTAIRVSPVGRFNGMDESDPVATFVHGARALSDRKLAYLHVIDAQPGHFMHTPGQPRVYPHLREAFTGALVLNGGFTLESATALLAEGWADAISFGIPFIANPDLPERLRDGSTLARPDPSTFYSPGERGYTDYPPQGG